MLRKKRLSNANGQQEGSGSAASSDAASASSPEKISDGMKEGRQWEEGRKSDEVGAKVRQKERPNKERMSLPSLPRGSFSYDVCRGRGRRRSSKKYDGNDKQAA